MLLNHFNVKTLSLFILTLLVSGCETADETAKEITPPSITEKGVLGTWSHSGTDTVLPLLAIEWYIQENKTTVVHRCEFSENVAVDAVVNSKLTGSLLTLNESDSETITEGDKTCSVSVTGGTSYALSLVDNNTLRITRNGVSVEYTRMKPISSSDPDLESEEDLSSEE